MAQKKPKQNPSHARFTPKKILCLAAALVLFSAVVSMIVTAHSGQSRAAHLIRGVFTPRGEVVDGVLDLGSAESLSIPEGEIGYFLNRSVVFQDGYAKGDILLQNPKECAYVLQLRIYLADGSSNRPIYTSPKLQPGQYISGDKLGKYLAAGTYDCTFTVTAYDQADGSQQGLRSGFLTVAVMS